MAAGAYTQIVIQKSRAKGVTHMHTLTWTLMHGARTHTLINHARTYARTHTHSHSAFLTESHRQGVKKISK